ncbi:MAG TPA: CocE/NonD family hydrolase [Acidimicrobiales bacterium]
MRRFVVAAMVVVLAGVWPVGVDAAPRPGGDDAGPAPWLVRPGVEQVTVTGAEPHQPLTLWSHPRNRPKQRLLTLLADEHGQAHFSYLPAEHMTLQSGPDLDLGDIEGVERGGVVTAGRYVIRDDSQRPALSTAVFEVLGRDDVPDPALYDRQRLTAATPDILGNPKPGAPLDQGFNYLEMRDGVLLSAMVRLPDEAVHGPGPYPTVIEYSGYGTSNPANEEPSSRLARALGYATVSVNMRGTGCSGGVFDVFNPAQMADGYDIVEIVARQPWVLHGTVGMVGLSYSGIAQLYAAATQPPHLAAVTPLSVIADPWLQQYPGGIYNSGFTRQWLAERDRQSAPGGSSWVQRRIDDGDQVCAGHMALRNQNLDFEAFGRALRTYHPMASARDLRRLVADISVPVFLAGAFQDEQTGAQFATMLDDFTSTPQLKVGLWNGRHPDGLSPVNVVRWFEFLEFHVAQRVPRMHPVLRAFLPVVLADEFDLADATIEPDRWYDTYGDDYAAARAAYDAEDPVRVIFESGIGANEPGEPGGTFERTFPTWPAPGVAPTTWYLAADGRLQAEAPRPRRGDGVDSFRFDPDAGQRRFYPDGAYPLMARLWTGADWSQFAEGDVLSYLTEPLAEDTVIAGPGYANLWVASDATDVDVQVSVSEVRPDGVEYLVQNGWLKLGHRALDRSRSDELTTTHFFTAERYQPLRPGKFVEARVEIPSLAHVFRAGSQLRLTISSPGRNHATWAFEAPDYGGAEPVQQVAHTRDRPSALVLPVLPGVDVPSVAPAPCPSLRGMACRPYEARTNVVVDDGRGHGPGRPGGHHGPGRPDGHHGHGRPDRHGVPCGHGRLY